MLILRWSHYFVNADEMRSSIWDSQTFNDYQQDDGQYEMPEAHGTAHLNVSSANGDAISVTTDNYHK